MRCRLPRSQPVFRLLLFYWEWLSACGWGFAAKCANRADESIDQLNISRREFDIERILISFKTFLSLANHLDYCTKNRSCSLILRTIYYFAGLYIVYFIKAIAS